MMTAAIVETLCGAFLVGGAVAVFGQPVVAWRTALVANLVAVAGVLLGMFALAAGRGATHRQ